MIEARPQKHLVEAPFKALDEQPDHMAASNVLCIFLFLSKPFHSNYVAGNLTTKGLTN